jgi:hypothetical protein
MAERIRQVFWRAGQPEGAKRCIPEVGGNGRLPEVGDNNDSRQSAWNFFCVISGSARHVGENDDKRKDQIVFFISHAKSARHF